MMAGTSFGCACKTGFSKSQSKQVLVLRFCCGLGGSAAKASRAFPLTPYTDASTPPPPTDAAPAPGMCDHDLSVLDKIVGLIWQTFCSAIGAASVS